jgi:hypothetical protein
VFRSLNLKQQDERGQPTWALTSPEARYDIRHRVAQARSPQGVIYVAGKPLYRLQATSGTVINDGEVIVLEGGIRVERHGAQPVLITARRARWLPSKNLLRIDRAPMAEDGLHRLEAHRARFLFDRDRLELEGAPRIERWGQPSDPFSRQRRTNPEVVALPQRLTWQPGQGALEAEGPLRITRRPPGRPRQALPQTLTAAGLNGSKLSSHSMRGGGAVAAFTMGKGDLYILREGRWAAIKSLLLYIRTLAEPYTYATMQELFPGIFEIPK